MKQNSQAVTARSNAQHLRKPPSYYFQAASHFQVRLVIIRDQSWVGSALFSSIIIYEAPGTTLT